MPKENEVAKVWWKKNLEKLRTEIHRLFNKIKSKNTCETYKSKPTQYNKEIRMAKRDSWRKFSEELQELYPESSSQGKQYCGRSGFLQKSRWNLHNLIRRALRNYKNFIFRPRKSWRVLVGQPYRIEGRISQNKITGCWSQRSRDPQESNECWAPFKSAGMDDIFPDLLQKWIEERIPHLTKSTAHCMAKGKDNTYTYLK